MNGPRCLRAALGTAALLAALVSVPTTAANPAVGAPAALSPLAVLFPPEAQASWQLRWAPEASRDGLDAFEGVEDDRANSHPAGQPHIFVQGNDYRFNMHMVDRDSSTDRQRQEVKGMRWPAGGSYLNLRLGETWRFTQSMYIPSSLKATTTFTHIMQTKAPGTGTSPMMVMSLRRHGSTPKIELKVTEGNILVGAVDLAPLQNRWIDVELEMTIGDAPDGRVRWVVRDGATTVIDTNRSGVDTWLEDRVRPKWGIYRSLGDSSGSLQDCYLLLRNMRAYQLVSGSAGYEAESATLGGSAASTSCAACSAGAKVRYIGNGSANTVTFGNVQSATAGSRQLTLHYAVDGTRSFFVSVNGGAATEVSVSGTSWSTPASRTITVALAAGTNTIRFANPGAWAPDLDRITVG